MTKIRAKKSRTNCLMRQGEMRYAVTYACAGVHIMRIFIIRTPHWMYLVDQMKKNEMGGHVLHMGERRGVCRVLMRKLEGKRSLTRPRRGWEMDL